MGTGHRSTHRGTLPVRRVLKKLSPVETASLERSTSETRLEWTHSLDHGDKRKGGQLEMELTSDPSPTLTWEPWVCMSFRLVAASMKYNATNYPDFRFNINL